MFNTKFKYQMCTSKLICFTLLTSTKGPEDIEGKKAEMSTRKISRRASVRMVILYYLLLSDICLCHVIHINIDFLANIFVHLSVYFCMWMLLLNILCVHCFNR